MLSGAVFALVHSVLKCGLDLGSQITAGHGQALAHQSTNLVTGSGGAVECGGGVVSALLLQADLDGQSGNVVAAVSAFQICMWFSKVYRHK